MSLKFLEIKENKNKIFNIRCFAQIFRSWILQHFKPLIFILQNPPVIDVQANNPDNNLVEQDAVRRQDYSPIANLSQAQPQM